MTAPHCRCIHWGSSYKVGDIVIKKCHACGAEQKVVK